MSELNAADRFLYSTLTGDTALAAIIGARCYSDLAPQGATIVTPYCIFTMLSATDLMVIGGVRVWTNTLYLVHGTAETLSWTGAIKTIADRIDATLHISSGTNTDGVIYDCVREQAWRKTETADGKTYRSQGGIFRIHAK